MLEYFTTEWGGINRSVWLLLLQATIQNASAEASEKAMYFTGDMFPSNVPTTSLPTPHQRQTQKDVNKLNGGGRGSNFHPSFASDHRYLLLLRTVRQ